MELHWEWCHACGFDPEGKRPQDAAPAAASSSVLLQGADTAAPSGWDAPLPGSFDGGSPSGGGFSLLDAPPASSFDAPRPSSFDAPPASSFDAPPASSFDAPPASSFDSIPSAMRDTATLPPPPAAAPSAAPVPVGSSFDTDALYSGAAFSTTPEPPRGLKRPDTDSTSISRIPGANAFRTMPLEGRGAKVLFGVLAGVAVLAMFVVAGSKIASTERAVPTTTTNPAAPPIGAIDLAPGKSTTSAPPADGWVPFRSPDGTFSVHFPKAPERRGNYAIVDGDSLPTLVVFAEPATPGLGFAVETLDLPSSTMFADGQQLIERMNAGSGQDMAVTGTTDVGGVSAATFTATSDGNAERGMVIVKGARAYFVYGVGQPDAEVDRFLASFRITGDVTRN